MRYRSETTSTIPLLALAAAVLAGLALMGRWSNVTFHSLVELFSVGVAMAILLIAWNVRRHLNNDFLLFIAVTYAAAAVLDLFHTLAYPGIGTIPPGGWIRPLNSGSRRVTCSPCHC